jgi:hypothetical protein
MHLMNICVFMPEATHEAQGPLLTQPHKYTMSNIDDGELFNILLILLIRY